MDNVTHAVMGAAIAEALAGKTLGKKALLWGALAANIPDIDVLCATYQSVPDSLLSHRGFTHSILFCVVASFLFAWLFKRWKHSGSNDFRLWLILFSTCLFSHILIDACTAYGTGWFEPFSHYRVSFDTIFVVDPFYTLPLLISTVAILILKRNSTKRKAWNVFGSGVSTLYIVFTLFNKMSADKIAEQNISEKKIACKDYIATPTPLNNFLWYIIVQDTSGFYISYHSIFDKTDHLDFNYYPRNKNLLAPYLVDRGVDKLIRFSQGYYCMTEDSGTVTFHDLRFGQIGGWDNAVAPFIFSYHFGHDESNELVIQRGRFTIANKGAIASLIDRIKGR